MSIVQGDYPQNPLPTIFAEQVSSPAREREQGGILISRSMIATVSLILIGMLIAAAFMFYSRWKTADSSLSGLSAKLTAAQTMNAKLVEQGDAMQNRLAQYAEIERLQANAKAKVAKIRNALEVKKGFPSKKLMNMDPPLWKERTEADLSTYNDKLDSQFNTIRDWNPPGGGKVVIGGALPPGAIRPTQ